MKKIVVLVMISITLMAHMTFSNPQPTFVHPRRWLIKLHVDNYHIVHHTLGAIYNLLSLYPPDSLSVLVIAYGPGDKVLMKNYNKTAIQHIKSLMNYRVKFVVCENTMKTMGWKKSQFIKGVKYVKFGIADVLEKKQAGWIDVTPY